MTLEQLEIIINKLDKYELRNKIDNPSLYLKNLSDSEVNNIIKMEIKEEEIPLEDYKRIFEEWIKLPLDELNYLISVLEKFYSIKNKCFSFEGENFSLYMHNHKPALPFFDNIKESLVDIVLRGYGKNKAAVEKDINLILKRFDNMIVYYNKIKVNSLDFLEDELKSIIYMCDISKHDIDLKPRKLHDDIMKLLFYSNIPTDLSVIREPKTKILKENIISNIYSVEKFNHNDYFNCLKEIYNQESENIIDNILKLLSKITNNNQKDIFEFIKLVSEAKTDHISNNVISALTRAEDEFKDNKKCKVNMLECIRYVATAKSDMLSDCMFNIMFYPNFMSSGNQLCQMKMVSELDDNAAAAFSLRLSSEDKNEFDEIDEVWFNASVYVAENERTSELPDSVFSIKKTAKKQNDSNA